jgi:HlyD family secretion protein
VKRKIRTNTPRDAAGRTFKELKPQQANLNVSLSSLTPKLFAPLGAAASGLGQLWFARRQNFGLAFRLKRNSWATVGLLAAFGSVAIGSTLVWPARAPIVAQAPSQLEPVSRQYLATAPGMVEPVSEEREVGSQVIGVIKEVRVDENDEVQEGQIIAVINNAEQVARLASARAELALRRAELERCINGARIQERREARAALMEAEANLRLARTDYQRRVPLAKTGVSSQASLDLATSTLQASEARRDAMAERLAVLEAGSRAEDIAAARARLSLAEANVALAEALLDKTFIRSPVSGTVLRRVRIAGEPVTNMPPTPIAAIGNLHGLRVRAEVDETDVGQVVAGQRVEVTADAYPNRKFGGAVYRVSSRMGEKQVLTGRPADRVDAKVLQVLIDLDPGIKLPIGLRVDVFFLGGPRLSLAEGRSIAHQGGEPFGGLYREHADGVQP